MRGYIFIVILLYAAAFTLADTIILKNRNRLVGTIVKETKSTIVLEMAYGKISVNKKEIAKIERDNVVDTVVYQGERLISLGAIDHAIEYFEKAIGKYPEKAESLKKALAGAYLRAGRKYLEKDHIELARNAMEKAQRYNPKLNVGNTLQMIAKRENRGQKFVLQGDHFLEAKRMTEALSSYLKGLKDYPGLAGEIAERLAVSAIAVGDQHLREQRFSRAVDHYNLALEHQPKLFPQIQKRWLYAKVQQISRKYIPENNWAEAIDELGEILKVEPTYPPALFFTGVAFEKQGQLREAFFSYQRILDRHNSWTGDAGDLTELRQLARAKAGVGFSENLFQTPQVPVAKSSGNWEKIRTAHFEIFHQNLEVATKTARHLEYHFANIERRLGPTESKKWLRPCEVYIYPTREEYLAKTGMAAWSEGVSNMRYSGGRLLHHSVHVYMSASLLFSTILPHELTHIAYPWFLDYEIQFPLWLSEGIACSSEPDFRKRSRFRVFRNALRKGENIPLDKLTSARSYPEDEKVVELFYAQSFSIIEYLLEVGGAQKMLEFSANLRGNFARAIRKVYGYSSVETLEQEWLEYVQTKRLR